MAKTIIVSNRLPLQIKKKDKNFEFTPSVGGLATGMKSVHESADSLWIGWTGLDQEDISKEQVPKIKESLLKEKCVEVNLTHDEVQRYYYGFSNRTLWPLFHYFTEYTEFESNFWEAYKKVNQKFAKAVLSVLSRDDTIWIHDYQLLLLPKMIKEKMPNVSVGFFLHIPFPSFEVFRILPWREEILNGMLGADLLGFHTYNYERHFLSSVRRLLGHDISFNIINLEDRIVKVDSFPMGIDYDRFHKEALKHRKDEGKNKTKLRREIDEQQQFTPETKLILSIDRLDYTKGIANRLDAFEYFLTRYPEYKRKVTLVMLAVPSRSGVQQYQIMKSEVDECVGRINGKFSSINWTPVHYFYRSLPFEDLVDLYTACDIAMITPVRDGMNLVAKEYVATRVNQKGVLILSEMAGAAQEMSEAITINPSNYEQIADAIKEAIEMKEDEQAERIKVMQERLKRYNIEKWAHDFMDSIEKVKRLQAGYTSKNLVPSIKNKILEDYSEASKRILFLDYDGTLVGFKNKPELAVPDAQLYRLLDNLASDQKNEIVLISGRDRKTMDKWFNGRNYTLIVEHGVWIKKHGKDWELIEAMNNDWKEIIKPVMDVYVDRTPGSFMEEKNYSLVWHYRKVDPELSFIRSNELKDELTSFVANHNLEIMEGNKVVEVKNAGINKGKAAFKMLDNNTNFIMGIGDDWTDEYLFEELPDKAITIKVGLKNTHARFNVQTFNEVRNLLHDFTKIM
jgi:trehalose 6-phosphate synthase/phosphatase